MSQASKFLSQLESTTITKVEGVWDNDQITVTCPFCGKIHTHKMKHPDSSPNTRMVTPCKKVYWIDLKRTDVLE